jgi:hypothetical protein
MSDDDDGPQPFRHRYLALPETDRSIAAIHSLLERGTDRAIVALLAEIREDPFSTAAENALAAAETSTVYGYPALIRISIAKWRDEFAPVD